MRVSLVLLLVLYSKSIVLIYYYDLGLMNNENDFLWRRGKNTSNNSELNELEFSDSEEELNRSNSSHKKKLYNNDSSVS